jgi:hypothetical protein
MSDQSKDCEACYGTGNGPRASSKGHYNEAQVIPKASPAAADSTC